MITYKNLKLNLVEKTKDKLTFEVHENDVSLGLCEVYTKSKFFLAFKLNINSISMDEDHLKSIISDLTNYFNDGINNN